MEPIIIKTNKHIIEIFKTHSKSSIDSYCFKYKTKREKDFHWGWYNSFQSCLEKLNKITKSEYEKKLRNEKDKITAVENRNKVKEGDLFRTSWGYDNTYVDFYIVKKKLSHAKVLVQQIDKFSVSEGYMSNNVKPNPAFEIGEPKVCTINKYGNISNIDEYGHVGYTAEFGKEYYQSWMN